MLSACSTHQIIRDSDYDLAISAFKSGDIEQALQRFPKKEVGGYITSLEKSWIALWTEEKGHADLTRQAATLEDRKFTSVTREAKYFFYSESEDGYIPAEHEIIVMHLINAMYFMKNDKWDEARVETQKATFFIQNYFKDDQSHFDDPALRLWLGGLWATLGEWQDAQVDFRKAYELSKNKDLLPLIDASRPPANLTLVFDGSSPTLKWREDAPAPEFHNETAAPKLTIAFSTLPWFLRHEERNSEIRSIVLNSNYMAQYYGLSTTVGAEKSLGFVASNSLRMAGLISGAVIIGGGLYLLAQSGVTGGGDAVGYIFAAGALVFGELWSEGNKVALKFDRSASETKESGLKNLRTYRFVRFLPNWISLTPEEVPALGSAKVLSLSAPFAKTSVRFLQRF